ncbi:TRAP transporter small permease [Acidaminobacter sp. JC074]|uniref:TRAP transporter small permease n=1 Tax=Acidaminobacter sp. JC074 TaxID=2530199 RepID=UPI001F0DE9B7|nr:TRAP transporter small permease [Acidaminobacter sp. JC074]MCH4886505.1 TRAP transporter small permease [Acidaminobacter sp. JC074]
MNNFLNRFKKDFELYIGSIFLTVTSVIVIMNVFTRYFLNFTFSWTEEIAVGAFVWVIFLGFANAYKKKSVIGVEVLVKLLPPRGRLVLNAITSIIVVLLSGSMFYLSFQYVMNSTKITVALEISYIYIQISIVISFFLITLYSIYFAYDDIKQFFATKNTDKEGIE